MPEQLKGAEQKLMAVLSRLHRQQQALDAALITRVARLKFPDLAGGWQPEMDALQRQGLIHAEGAGPYALTAEGEALAGCMEAESLLDRLFYDVYYERAEESAAYNQLCELAYGIALCQHGMADRGQLDLLTEMLHGQGCREVLEIGCGNGMTAAYLQERLGISITGIDFSPAAIARAVQRAAGDPRLRFLTMDMNALQFPAQCFEAVIAIDSLYFARDLRQVLKTAAVLLRPGGCIYAFFSPWEAAAAEETQLGTACRELGYPFAATDLSAADRAFEERMGEALRTFAPDFAAEGNLFLYNNRLAEWEGDGMKANRYMYCIQPSGLPASRNTAPPQA